MTNVTKNKMKPINLRVLFRERNPGLAKVLPEFFFRYLDRVIHIDEVNEIIELFGHLEGAQFARAVVEHCNVRKKIVGIENVPTEGRFIFAANHPLGGFDAMLLMSEVSSRIGEGMRFLANDVLTEIKPLEDIFIPINKFGGKSREAVKLSNEAYNSDKQILIFPSGLISRKRNNVIKDRVWKKHFIQKSIQHERDVIPVHISGRNSNFFYRLANIRRAIGIPWNIEMFYLADEFFRHKNTDVQLTFGKPISYKSFDKTHSQDEWAQKVKEILYSLPETE